MNTDATFTPEARERLQAYLFAPGRILPPGLGTREQACSIAAINIALTGTLTDEIPDCMSRVIGQWIITIQDEMPDDQRNSERWKLALVSAAGTGRERERERFALVMDWLWGTVLPLVQPIADEYRIGESWRKMCDERTVDAAQAAYDDADIADDAAQAASVADNKATAICEATIAAYNVALNVSHYDAACHYAARAARVVVCAKGAGAWADIDPVGLLERLVAVR